MKSFTNFLNEETKHETIYDKKKMAIKTPTFEGHAHIKFDREYGKYGTHDYRVTYKGVATHRSGATKDIPGNDSHRLKVHHGSDGKPFKYEMDGKSAKTLKDILHRHAPVLVSADDLK